MSAVYILAPFDETGQKGLLPLYTGFVSQGLTTKALPYFAKTISASDDAVQGFLAEAQQEEAVVVIEGEVMAPWQLYLSPEKTAIIDGYWPEAAYHFSARRYDNWQTAQLAMQALADEVYLFACVANEHLLYAESRFFKSSQPHLHKIQHQRAYHLWCAFVLAQRVLGESPENALQKASTQLAQATIERFGDDLHPQAFF